MLTPEQVSQYRAKYNIATPPSANEPLRGPSLLTATAPQPTETKEPGFLSRVGSDISSRISNIQQEKDTASPTIAGQAQGILRTAGQIAGGINDVIGEGIQSIAPGIPHAIQKIANTDWGKGVAERYQAYAQANPDAAKNLESVFNIGTAATALEGGVKSVGKLKEIAPQVKPMVTGLAGDIKSSVKNATTTGISKVTTPESIMNRVARLNPKEEVKFTKLAQKTPGQYLTETGNFGAPDKIIGTEAKKFATSKNMVDTELARLPGEYKVPAINDALNLLREKALSVSTENVPASFAGRLNQLIAKSKTGLNMSEINEVKRLAEKELKLGYNKTLNPDKVQTATNVDSAIRDWQVTKAKELGFKNISELNKQTQISKFIIDKLGDKVVGQQALNGLGLTDWIILAGGDPTAVGGFLAKKFFSSKGVQARIAKMLNTKEVQSLVTPEISLNPEYLNPEKALPSGKIVEGQYPVQGEKVIPAAPTTYEGQAGKISKGLKGQGEIPSTKSAPGEAIVPKVDDIAIEARNKADKVFKLMGNELEDIQVIGSTARGKLNPNDLDILVTPKKPLGELTSRELHNRIALQKTFEDELKPLFPDRKIHVTISKYDANRGPKMEIGGSSPLTQEALKYKSAEEFVKAFNKGTFSDFVSGRLGGKVTKRGELLVGGDFPSVIGRGDEVSVSGNRLGIRLGEFENKIDVSGISLENKGTGMGSKVMDELRNYADIKDKELTIFKVTNPKFFDRFTWLKKKGDVYVYEPSGVTNRLDFTRDSKSQLTDLYNQAKSGAKKSKK